MSIKLHPRTFTCVHKNNLWWGQIKELSKFLDVYSIQVYLGHGRLQAVCKGLHDSQSTQLVLVIRTLQNGSQHMVHVYTYMSTSHTQKERKERREGSTTKLKI